MTEYRKQAAFLKALLMYDETDEHRVLLDRLAGAERNERCLLAACCLVGLITLLGLAGLGYSAVLLPGFFDSSAHILIRMFGALGLGSFFCLLAFVGLWLWYRGAVNRVHDDCRRVIMRMIETRLCLGAANHSPLPVSADDPILKLLSDPLGQAHGTAALSGLHRAS